jgi:hypothetical protein
VGYPEEQFLMESASPMDYILVSHMASRTEFHKEFLPLALSRALPLGLSVLGVGHRRSRRREVEEVVVEQEQVPGQEMVLDTVPAVVPALVALEEQVEEKSVVVPVAVAE